MTSADTFHNSGLDHKEWAKRMVSERKMYYPKKRSIEIKLPTTKRDDSLTYKLNNIVCEGLGGKDGDYEKGKDKFCNMIHQYATANLLGAEYVLQNALCGDGDACDLLTWMGFSGAGYVIRTRIDEFCPKGLEALR